MATPKRLALRWDERPNAVRPFGVLFALIATCVLWSCSNAQTAGNADGTSSPSVAVKAWSVPPGVFVPKAKLGNYEVDGLFSTSQSPDPSCCWMAPDARIRFMKAKGAARLTLALFVNPDVPIYRKERPHIRVALHGKILIDKCCLPAGPTDVVVTLPPDVRSGVGPYELAVSSSAFVPAEEHMNGDTRRLGLVLQRLDVR